MSDRPPPRVSYAVPPGGQMRANLVTKERTAWIPLWIYWLQIANRHADAAEVASRVDQPTSLVMARQVHVTGPTVGPGGNLEMVEAMVAITSAANALDAVFGSLKRVDPWKPPGGRRLGAKRSGEILEQLKQSFAVGKYAREWSQELEWVFKLRDDIVHHGEEPRSMVITAADERDIVLSATEAYSLTARSARKAVGLVEQILQVCLAQPRPRVVRWAERARLLKQNFGKSPGPSGPTPRIKVTQAGQDLLITAEVPDQLDTESTP